ncbi:hypothetical protein V6N11_047668 [Hibiscus sabdariffa]|uniref:Uncharacterized protein n=1 Tax=Hibiscus sabdariffa TaxID=183260 RepID=A0ABR2P7L9_9ROSI
MLWSFYVVEMEMRSMAPLSKQRPQQLKYMTVLRDSSASFRRSLLEEAALKAPPPPVLAALGEHLACLEEQEEAVEDEEEEEEEESLRDMSLHSDMDAGFSAQSF